MEPVCWCGRSAVLRTSWTDANPGRRFWGCLRFMEDRANACNYHSWFDPPMCSRSKTIIPGLLRKVQKLEDEVKKYEAVVAEDKGKKRRPILFFLVLGFLVCIFVVMNKDVEASSKGQYELP